MARSPVSSLLDAVISAGGKALGVRLDAAPTVNATPPSPPPQGRSVLDCSGGGCGPFFGGMSQGPALITPSLDRPTIDDIYTSQLMRRIVTLIVEDALSVRPSLSGKTGELSGCIDWLEERCFFSEFERACIYARKYGGGGIVILADDGRRADEEINLLALRDVVGFYALPKWYLTPAGMASGRVSAAWYGPRIGRPEHYYVTPNVGVGGDAHGSYNDLLKIIAKSGTRFHRSRVIPFPYVHDLDSREARWLPQWHGWGPGVVEAVFDAFMARRTGAMRLTAIMNSIVVNTLTISDLEHRQSTPDLGAALRQRLELIKACRDFTEAAGVPLIATDPSNKLESLTHNVSGIDKIIAAQRQNLLDVVEYTGVVLFGDSVGGLNGGDRMGERSIYATRVASLQRSWLWTAGSFGGGLRQACLLAMACPGGPTDGRMDMTVRADWPSILAASDGDKSDVRLKNAKARELDAQVLGLTPGAMLRFDPDIRASYPGLDVDEGTLPAVAPPSGEDVPGTKPATTPVASVSTDVDNAAVDAPLTTAPIDLRPIPGDLMTETEIAASLRMTKQATRKMLQERGVKPFVDIKGARGGGRWSLSEVLKAFEEQARQRADAVRTCRNGQTDNS